jgi:hypothetical protein
MTGAADPCLRGARPARLGETFLPREIRAWSVKEGTSPGAHTPT